MNQVSGQAASALAQAKAARADKLAPYEYTQASEYLQKAREEASYSSYQSAIEYGRRAQEQAQKALSAALEKPGPDEAAPPARRSRRAQPQ